MDAAQYERPKNKCSWFSRFATGTAKISGHPMTFVVAVACILLWASLGPHYHYGDTWQLVINTSTTIITFLMVFLIQDSQNRDAGAIQIKLDELIRAQKEANNALLDIEELDEKEINKLRKDYGKLAQQSRDELLKNDSPS